MNTKNKKIVILGAGIAGAASAYYLSKLNLKLEIVVIDKLSPLSFTTSCSGENFREYWPQPMMNEFIGRSIELMKDLDSVYDNCFKLKYSGYDFVTQQTNHSIFPTENLATNVIERLEDKIKIRSLKPYLDESISAIEHIKNAGSIDVYALGSLFIKLAKENGVRFITDEVIDIEKNTAFKVHLKSKLLIESDYLLLASGPFINNHINMLGHDLPIYNTKQRKFVFKDTKNIIPRYMPFTIYADKQFLDWNDEERQLINNDEDFQWLLKEFPAGLHIKPEGQDQIKMGWAYNTEKEEPQWDIFADDEFVSVVLKGVSRFIPKLSYYAENMPPSVVHFAGYYTRTDDNLPVIGKVDEGLYTVGAFAGYGTMAACATGELISSLIKQDSKHDSESNKLPDYSRYFSPLRFNDDDMMQEISQYPSGQL